MIDDKADAEKKENKEGKDSKDDKKVRCVENEALYRTKVLQGFGIDWKFEHLLIYNKSINRWDENQLFIDDN